jgi:hypothetical protein
VTSRRTGHTGLALLLLAAAFTVGDWFPAPRAHAVPETIFRAVSVDAASIAAGPAQPTAAGALRAAADAVTASRVVCPGIRFTSVAISWTQPSGRSPHVLLRAGETVGTLRREFEVHADHGPDPGTAEAANARRATDPFWVESARCVAFRMEVFSGIEIRGLRAEFVNTSGTAGVPTAWRQSAGASMEGPGVAGATANAPYWITRAGWGADESLRNCEPSYAEKLKVAFVHHTATENDYAKDKADDIMRSIYYFHTQTNGWCDIAYNFLVDRFGRVYIGRYGGPSLNVIGAAQQGFNTGAVSVSGIGTYSTTTPSTSLVYSIKKTLAWRLDVAHLPPKGWAWMVSGGGPNTRYPAGTGVTLNLITSHRATGYTTCPGDKLQANLAGIRQGANDIGLPKLWRFKQSPEGGITPGLDTVNYTATASESLNWVVTITSPTTGLPVRTIKATGLTLDVEWDGMNGAFPAAAGDYSVKVTATNAAGGIARAASLVTTVFDPVNELPVP